MFERIQEQIRAAIFGYDNNDGSDDDDADDDCTDGPTDNIVTARYGTS